MNSTTIAQVLKERIPHLMAIYQFGSQTRGEARPTSDVDLAVLAHEPITPAHLFEIAQDLAAQLHRDVDLLDLRAVSTVMRMQVVSTGQRLETSHVQAVAEFEMYTYADYARLNEERRDLLKEITQSGLVYG